MKKADLITGVVLLVLSGLRDMGVLADASVINLRAGAGISPLLARGASGGVGNDPVRFHLASSGDGEGQRNPSSRGSRRCSRLRRSWLVLRVYILLIEVLGYLVDTFLFIVFLMKAVEREKWPLTLLIAVVTTAALFLTFQVLLQITLPSNMFGF